jgi:hypothetical protein
MSSKLVFGCFLFDTQLTLALQCLELRFSSFFPAGLKFLKELTDSKGIIGVGVGDANSI